MICAKQLNDAACIPSELPLDRLQHTTDLEFPGECSLAQVGGTRSRDQFWWALIGPSEGELAGAPRRPQRVSKFQSPDAPPRRSEA
jgi:hypothetical protein